MLAFKFIGYQLYYLWTESEELRLSDALKILEEQILTQNFVESFAELLISSYLILRKEDLLMWGEDPEGWVNFDETDHWEYQIRVCFI